MQLQASAQAGIERWGLAAEREAIEASSDLGQIEARIGALEDRALAGWRIIESAAERGMDYSAAWSKLDALLTVRLVAEKRRQFLLEERALADLMALGADLADAQAELQIGPGVKVMDWTRFVSFVTDELARMRRKDDMLVRKQWLQEVQNVLCAAGGDQ